jgi:hypothetical protein
MRRRIEGWINSLADAGRLDPAHFLGLRAIGTRLAAGTRARKHTENHRRWVPRARFLQGTPPGAASASIHPCFPTGSAAHPSNFR